MPKEVDTIVKREHDPSMGRTTRTTLLLPDNTFFFLTSSSSQKIEANTHYVVSGSALVRISLSAPTSTLSAYSSSDS